MKSECNNCSKNPKVNTTKSYKCYTPKCPFYKSTIKPFESRKRALLMHLNTLYGEYEELTKEVSPKYWHTTGRNLTELRLMKEDISNLGKITPKQLKNAKKHNLL